MLDRLTTRGKHTKRKALSFHYSSTGYRRILFLEGNQSQQEDKAGDPEPIHFDDRATKTGLQAELTKYQIDQIEQMIAQDHVVHWELKRGERADIERLISISRYRGIRHQDGSPLRGQRTHTNARTARKQIRK